MRHNHGLYRDENGKKARLYHIWEDMKNRCFNPKNRRFHRYGGRGIKVCQEWKDNYVAFYSWAMASGYDSKLTIDRIEVDGNYCPNNCKWSTPKEQGNNRSTNRVVEWDGKKLNIKQWAELLGFEPYVIRQRLNRGWPLERVFGKLPEIHKKSKDAA